MQPVDTPALYLECRYTRAETLRTIARQLNRRLYHTTDGVQRVRLRKRIDRVYRHLDALSGGSL